MLVVTPLLKKRLQKLEAWINSALKLQKIWELTSMIQSSTIWIKTTTGGLTMKSFKFVSIKCLNTKHGSMNNVKVKK